MTLFTTVNRVTDAIGLPRSAAVSSGTDQLSRQFFALANNTVEELAEKDWPQLEKAYQFTTVPNQNAYDLPADYARTVEGTLWLPEQYYEIRGSVTAGEWAKRKSGAFSDSRYRFRIYGNPLKLYVTPTPTEAVTMIGEYVSNAIVKTSSGATAALFTADDDTIVLPEKLLRMGLMWRIKHAKGLDYSEDFNLYQDAVNMQFAQSSGAGRIDVSHRYGYLEENWGMNVPETGFGG